jgi:hypothetical protein
MMARVSFRTKDGPVSFQTTGKRKRQRAKRANAYAKYVKANIGKFIRQGMSAPQAMKAVAKQYKRGK